MATILLSILIFGSAAAIIVHQWRKKSSCSDCNCPCPVKKEHK